MNSQKKQCPLIKLKEMFLRLQCQLGDYSYRECDGDCIQCHEEIDIFTEELKLEYKKKDR